jgi:hypothetical protein
MPAGLGAGFDWPVRLILDLAFDGGTATGTVGPPDGPVIAFHGWIGLMGAIHDLKERHDGSALDKAADNGADN